jgi:hypothetical protein
VTIAAQETLEQRDLFLDAATACRTLLTDMRGLAMFVFEGKLERYADGFRADEVFALKSQLARSAAGDGDRLQPQLHRLLEVLHDWKGRGTNGELATTLGRSPQAVADLLSRLKIMGFVVKTREGKGPGTWCLTKEGWAYMTNHSGGRM